MDQATKDIFSGVVTYAFVGTIGFFQAKRFKRPVKALTWIVLICCVLVFQYVLVGTRLFSIFGFNAYANWILQGFVLGVLLGLLVREMFSGKDDPSSAA